MERGEFDAPRRDLLRSGLGLALASTLPTIMVSFPTPAIGQGRRLVPTPEQTEGPYYPTELPADVDADLLRFAAAGGARPQGTPALVSGRVLDSRGQPIAGARVEIWQCDAHGRYHHVVLEPGPRSPDRAFQGFGRMVTDEQGRYAFRTIRPAPYPGRAPHIHYNVVAPGRRRLVTQLYAEGEPANARDRILQGIRDADARASVVRRFSSAPRAGLGPGAVAATFDVVLA